MRLFLGKLAACDTVISANDALRELRILQRPKAQQTAHQLFVICAVDIVLAVTDNNQVRVLHVHIDGGNHTSTVGLWIQVFHFRHSDVLVWLAGRFAALKCKQMLKRDLVIFGLFFVLFLLFFFFLFFASECSNASTSLLLLIFFILFVLLL